MITLKTPEDARQFRLLNSPLGEAGTGFARYGAAMHFYNRRMIGDDALEVYRILAKLDRENPRRSLISLGLAGETEARQTNSTTQKDNPL